MRSTSRHCAAASRAQGSGKWAAGSGWARRERHAPSHLSVVPDECGGSTRWRSTSHQVAQRCPRIAHRCRLRLSAHMQAGRNGERSSHGCAVNATNAFAQRCQTSCHALDMRSSRRLQAAGASGLWARRSHAGQSRLTQPAHGSSPRWMRDWRGKVRKRRRGANDWVSTSTSGQCSTR